MSEMTPMTQEARREPPRRGDELDTLRGMLDHHRDTLRWKCAGLSDEELNRRVLPSTMTLAGLVLHLTMVEAWWFNLVFAGGVAQPEWLAASGDGDHEWAWNNARRYSMEQLWAWYDEGVAVSDGVLDSVVSGPDGLDAVAADPERAVSMRWLLVHMIEEYARHNGHADLLREAIDGATGE